MDADSLPRQLPHQQSSTTSRLSLLHCCFRLLCLTAQVFALESPCHMLKQLLLLLLLLLLLYL
jgi:hypothetical protein